MNARIRYAVSGLAVLLALAGCTRPPAASAGRRVVFLCPGHAPISVIFADDMATLMAGGEPATLRVQRSGSGFRYAGAGQSLRGKGGALDWTDAAGTTHRCQARDWPPR